MAAKARRDDKGVYWVVVHHEGRRRKKRVGRDKRLAEEIARKIQARLVLGDFTMETEQKAPVPFRRFAHDWLRREVELPIERGLEGHHAPGTARGYRLQVEVHLGPHFKDVDVRSIGLAEVQRFYDHCIDTGRPRSAKSIDMALNVLRLILSHARGQALVETNAVQAWKSGRPRRRTPPRWRWPRRRCSRPRSWGPFCAWRRPTSRTSTRWCFSSRIRAPGSARRSRCAGSTWIWRAGRRE